MYLKFEISMARSPQKNHPTAPALSAGRLSLRLDLVLEHLDGLTATSNLLVI
jgi:hypothetical protein